ncbi:hypothetical protein [Hymenobacter baengnokdamensis]|uniref:hypothetical protein n=1 Tax=Hymenobacter baengnokdamensis TaxID=2615203 RepID=UPI001247CA32|nr:hypothetical protein [Hymenobacter baengnokdamensis]
MTFRRLFLVAPAVAALFLTGCKKDEPSPTTGNVHITYTYDAIFYGYSLFTEEGWRTYILTGSGGPLRSGSSSDRPPIVISNTRLKTEIIISTLNPGNYVFVIQSSTAKTVQVVAGQTTSYTFDL